MAFHMQERLLWAVLRTAHITQILICPNGYMFLRKFSLMELLIRLEH